MNNSNLASKKSLIIASIILTISLILIVGVLIVLSLSKPNQGQSNADTPTPTTLAQCEYNGVKYDSGESFNKGDSCNSCSCEDGKVSCEEKSCNEKFSTKLKRPGLDGSELYEYELSIELPDEATAKIFKNYGIEVNEEGFDFYIFPNLESNGNPLFEKMPPVTISNPYSENILRLPITDDLKKGIFTLYPELSKRDNTYFYSSYYSENKPCHLEYESILGKEVIGCYDTLIQIDFKNQSASTSIPTFQTFCGIDENNLSENCDNIVQTLEIKFVKTLSQ